VTLLRNTAVVLCGTVLAVVLLAGATNAPRAVTTPSKPTAAVCRIDRDCGVEAHCGDDGLCRPDVCQEDWDCPSGMSCASTGLCID